jgi:hypothetical protein
MWGFIFCGMNINSILDGINLVTRGRFSAKSGAAWVNWMGMVLSRIEAECPGVGTHTKVSALPMESGFVPTPPGIKHITGVFVDDEEVKYDRNQFGVWPTLEDQVLTSKTIPAVVMPLTETTVSIDMLPEIDDLLDIHGLKAIDAQIYWDSLLPAQIDVTITDPAIAANLENIDGYMVRHGNGALRVDASSKNLNGISFGATFSGVDPLNGTNECDLVGFLDGQFDGWSAVLGKHQIEIFSSPWSVPTNVQGWTSATRFDCTRKTYGRIAALGDGYVFQSNVKVSGYSSLSRPTTLTELIDLDDSYKQLLTDGLYMFAERDSDPSSNEAVVRTQIFEQSLKMYSIDQTQATFKSAPKKFSTTPRLGAANRGW